MAVYYKFKSAKDYDSVSIDGHFISVGNLKEKIVEKKNLGRGSDFDLLISNAQTNEEYTDDAQSIPKNTSVLVRRVPGRRQKPIVAEVKDEKIKEESPRDQASSVKHGIETSLTPLSKQVQLEESEWADEFGVDLYTMPEQVPFQQQLPQQQQQQQHQQQHVIEKSEEDNKIKAFVDASASDWQRQTQEIFSAGKGFGRGSQGRGLGGRGFGRGIGMEKKNPPQGYVCHRCGVPGHFIQHCPTNGDPAYDMKKMRPPTGIPKSMLVANPDGSYALPSGAVAILRPNEAVFEKEIEGLPSSRTIAEIPTELRCPLCNGVLKDAVLTSRCCFKSYCDKCIRDQILSNAKCVCGAMNVLADDLLPNKTLRDAINRLLETTTATSSAEHAGSLYQVQDVESAQRPKPKAPSPSGSASQKNGSVTLLPLPDGLNGKGVAISKLLPSQQTQQSPNRNLFHKRLEPFEHTAESNSRQEPASQGEVLGSQSTLQIEEEVQQETFADAAKKRKLKTKRQKPLNGEKEGYRRSAAAYEPHVDGGMMPYHGNPALYGNYWGGPQYIVDGFGQPIGNPQFPYFGYGVPGPVPVPCEMHYGAGIMLPEPVGHPAFMPPVPSFQRDGMDNNMGALNSGSSIMSREEFEARKAELRRKREFEQRVQNREEAKDTRSGDPGSSKVKRGSNFANSSASSPADELNDHVEKSTYYTHSKTSAGNSLSPQGVKRKRHERREETLILDTRFERTNVEVQKGLEAAERSEKKPKMSVFSRISFPENSKERPKRPMTEKHLDSKDSEGDGNTSIGLRSRRILGQGAERHSSVMDSVDSLRHVTSPQDSVKLVGSGRKSSYKEDRLRPTSRAMNKNKIQDEDYGTDDDNYERNFKHRASYSISPREVNTRSGKRRQS